MSEPALGQQAPLPDWQDLADQLGIKLEKPGAPAKKPKSQGAAPPAESAETHIVRQLSARHPGVLPEAPLECPVAFEPPAKPPYPPDAQDALLPLPGFVTDFAYSLKGKESPTIFNIFAALFALAVLGSRRTTFKWALGDFFPNLYVLFVAPPAICTKSAALQRAHDLLQALPDRLLDLGDAVLSEEKRVEAVTGSATPGGLMKIMSKKDGIFVLPDGSMHIEHFGSKAYVWNDEIVTLLNSQRYTEGLTNALTKFYDCRDKDSETFKSTDAPPLEHIYFNLAGAMTPMHVQRSLPEEVWLGGFMSRVVLVSQNVPTNFFPMPLNYEGFPMPCDLLDKLAWLAYATRGEYAFTEEAGRFYETFYMESKKADLAAGVDASNTARARYVHLAIRLSVLLRMSEYRPGHDVSLTNLKQAIALLDYVFLQGKHVTNLIGATPQKKNYIKIKNYLRKQGRVARAKLLRRMSRSACLKDETNSLLTQLKQEGLVVFLLNGKERTGDMPSMLASEEYEWQGPRDEEDDDGD